MFPLRSKHFARSLFWLWLAILILFNLIPLGTTAEQNLNNRSLILRLDYLVHFLTFLAFAGVFFLGRFFKQRIFLSHEIAKFGGITITAALLLESVQFLLTYRTFNPWDLVANLAGAAAGYGLVALCSLYSSSHQNLPIPINSTDDTNSIASLP